jgi:hypothetical protein
VIVPGTDEIVNQLKVIASVAGFCWYGSTRKSLAVAVHAIEHAIEHAKTVPHKCRMCLSLHACRSAARDDALSSQAHDTTRTCNVVDASGKDGVNEGLCNPACPGFAPVALANIASASTRVDAIDRGHRHVPREVCTRREAVPPWGRWWRRFVADTGWRDRSRTTPKGSPREPPDGHALGNRFAVRAIERVIPGVAAKRGNPRLRPKTPSA